MKEDGEGARALHSVRETTFRERAIAEDLQLAICMATHSRLGAASPIAVLTDTNLLREVCWQRRTQARSARNHTHTWRHARTRARARTHTHTHRSLLHVGLSANHIGDEGAKHLAGVLMLNKAVETLYLEVICVFAWCVMCVRGRR